MRRTVHTPLSQVPYNIEDADISDDWTCADNQWDPAHNHCTVPQELSNDQIDQILHAQVDICPSVPQIFDFLSDPLLCIVFII